MKRRPIFPCGWVAVVGGVLLLATETAFAENVKITPIGSHDGELCRLDRAMILEDPDGNPASL